MSDLTAPFNLHDADDERHRFEQVRASLACYLKSFPRVKYAPLFMQDCAGLLPAVKIGLGMVIREAQSGRLLVVVSCDRVRKVIHACLPGEFEARKAGAQVNLERVPFSIALLFYAESLEGVKSVSYQLKGKLWFSKKQAELRQEASRPPTLPGRLKDGTPVQYTQMNTGEHQDAGCDWDDAVYLGEGEYAGG